MFLLFWSWTFSCIRKKTKHQYILLKWEQIPSSFCAMEQWETNIHILFSHCNEILTILVLNMATAKTAEVWNVTLSTHIVLNKKYMVCCIWGRHVFSFFFLSTNWLKKKSLLILRESNKAVLFWHHYSCICLVWQANTLLKGILCGEMFTQR